MGRLGEPFEWLRRARARLCLAAAELNDNDDDGAPRLEVTAPSDRPLVRSLAPIDSGQNFGPRGESAHSPGPSARVASAGEPRAQSALGALARTRALGHGGGVVGCCCRCFCFWRASSSYSSSWPSLVVAGQLGGRPAGRQINDNANERSLEAGRRPGAYANHVRKMI